MASKAFLFQTTRNILSELGSSTSKLPGLVHHYGGRALLVTDRGITKLGLHREAVAQMGRDGVSVEVYDGVEEDPSVSVIEEATSRAKAMRADVVIGFGGGSSMDTAKLAAVLAKSDQPLDTMYGVNQLRPGTQRLSLIQVPTTAGTGSEVTPITIVTTAGCEKKGVVDPLLLPDYALLDGDLTLSCPRHVTSATGVDAMVHAIEAFTGRLKKNPVSDTLAVSALTLLGRNIRTVGSDPTNREARANMLLGACLAGMAFANSPVAAVHALAYPIGSHFKVPHGLSNALMLPHVARANLEVDACAAQYAQLAPYCLPDTIFRGPPRSVAEQLADGLALLMSDLGMKTQLREVNVGEKDIGLLASESMKQTRLLINNPREVDLQLATQLYSAAW